MHISNASKGQSNSNNDPFDNVITITLFLICVVGFGVLLYDIHRQANNNLYHNDELIRLRDVRRRDVRRAYHAWSDAMACKRITPDEETPVGDEYDGKVDEWGLFPEKPGEAGVEGEIEAIGECMESKTGYGTIRL